MKPPTIRILLAAIVLSLGLTGSLRASDADSFEVRGTFVAQIWMDAFRRLDARNNITMVLSNRDSYYELEHVVSIEAHGHFLVVRCEASAGVYYHALVYPSTIMLVKETPRAVEKKSG